MDRRSKRPATPPACPLRWKSRAAMGRRFKRPATPPVRPLRWTSDTAAQRALSIAELFNRIAADLSAFDIRALSWALAFPGIAEIAIYDRMISRCKDLFGGGHLEFLSLLTQSGSVAFGPFALCCAHPDIEAGVLMIATPQFRLGQINPIVYWLERYGFTFSDNERTKIPTYFARHCAVRGGIRAVIIESDTDSAWPAIISQCSTSEMVFFDGQTFNCFHPYLVRRKKALWCRPACTDGCRALQIAEDSGFTVTVSATFWGLMGKLTSPRVRFSSGRKMPSNFLWSLVVNYKGESASSPEGRRMEREQGTRCPEIWDEKGYCRDVREEMRRNYCCFL